MACAVDVCVVCACDVAADFADVLRRCHANQQGPLYLMACARATSTPKVHDVCGSVESCPSTSPPMVCAVNVCVVCACDVAADFADVLRRCHANQQGPLYLMACARATSTPKVHDVCGSVESCPSTSPPTPLLLSLWACVHLCYVGVARTRCDPFFFFSSIYSLRFLAVCSDHSVVYPLVQP